MDDTVKNKNYWMILGAGASVVLVALLIIFFYQKKDTDKVIEMEKSAVENIKEKVVLPTEKAQLDEKPLTLPKTPKPEIPIAPEIPKTPKIKFEKYTDADFGYSINHPADWEKFVSPGGDVSFVLPLVPIGAGGLFVDVDPFGSNPKLTLDKFVSDWLDFSQGDPGEKISGPHETTLAGNPARRFTVAGLLESGEKRSILAILSVKENKGYLIYYEAEPKTYTKYFEIVQEMIDSFKF